MQTVTVSSTYQVMIPNTIREMFELQPGQKIQVIPYKNRIELVPIASLQDARGLLKGIDPNFMHESEASQDSTLPESPLQGISALPGVQLN